MCDGPVIDVFVEGEPSPVEELRVQVGEPGRRDPDAAVEHELREERVQLVVLNQRLVLNMDSL